MTRAIRQGDVLLVPRSKPPLATKIPPKNGRVIVAEGEQTGHHHSLPASAAVAFMTPFGDLQLQVTEPTDLSHQEHHALPVEPTNYDVVQQRRASGGSRHSEYSSD